MPVLLTLVLVLTGAGVLGRLLLIGLAGQIGSGVGDVVEVILLSLALGIFVLGWIGLVLAELGWFSLWTLGAIWAALLVVLVFLWRRLVLRSRLVSTQARWMELVALGAWLVAACYLFFRPHEFIVGGADAGVYVNLGSNIARTGSILIHDSTLAQLDPALYPALLREYISHQPVPYYSFPGFYVPGQPAGLVIPQFYPLHPVWLAVLYGLGGVRANLMGTPLWALLASLSIYLAVRQMFGWKVALLSLAGLTINAMQIWFARYPTAEMLTQYLFWTGVYAFAAWLSDRRPARLWALVAGLGLGQVFLTRIDTYFLLAVPLSLAVWLRWQKRRLAGWQWFFVPLIGLALHSFFHAAVLSWPYFMDTFQAFLGLLQRYATVLVALALLGVAGLIVIDRRPDWREWVIQRWAARRPVVLWGSVVVLVALAVYAYWIRPASGVITTASYWYGGGEIPTNLDKENLVRLGWYLSPLGLALAVCGVCVLMLKLNRTTVLFMGSGLFFSLLYLWRIQANPHQIYTMRRYVPVVMPFFIVTAAFCVMWLYEHRLRWWKVAGLILGVAWLASLAWLARGFVSQVDYRGAMAQLDALNARLAPHSVLIFDDQTLVGQGDALGTPLHFLYGQDVFVLRRPELVSDGQFERQIDRWQAEHREVYWLGHAENQAVLGQHTLEPQGDYRVSLIVLEPTYDHRPYRRVPIEWGGSLARVSDGAIQ